MALRSFYAYSFENNSTYENKVDIDEPRQCMHCCQTGVQNFIAGIITDGNNDKFDSISLFTCSLCASTTVHFSLLVPERAMSFDDKVLRSFESIPFIKEKLKSISVDYK